MYNDHPTNNGPDVDSIEEQTKKGFDIPRKILYRDIKGFTMEQHGEEEFGEVIEEGAKI